MECKKCGKTAAEGATFCGYCGARVDGKIPCKACGQLNDENFVYCTACGARMDNKTVCTSCGTAYEGNFCPTCGERGQVCVERKKTAKNTAAKSGLFQRIVQIVGGASAMVGTLFALVFVFFIGATQTVVSGNNSVSESTNIYSFFGSFYKDLDAMTSSATTITPWFVRLVDTWGTVMGVLGTLLVCLSLLSVVAFAAVAIVKYVRSWVYKSEDNSFGWALATVVSFLVSATLFYAYCRVSSSGNGSLLGGGGETTCSYNGATSTAIIFIGIFVGLAIVCRIVAAGKSIWTSAKLGKTVCALIGITVTCVLLGIVRASGSSFTVMVQGQTVEASAGYLNFATAVDIALAAMASTMVDEQGALYEKITDELAMMNVYAMIAQVLLFAVAIFAAIALYKNIRSATGEKKSGLVWSILAVVSSAVLLVFHILTWNSFEGAYGKLLNALSQNSGTTYTLSTSCAVPICLIVFSVLLLAASIVGKALTKKEEN